MAIPRITQLCFMLSLTIVAAMLQTSSADCGVPHQCFEDQAKGSIKVIKTTDPDVCCNACMQNPRCVGYLIAPKKGLCHLKALTQRIKGGCSGDSCHPCAFANHPSPSPPLPRGPEWGPGATAAPEKYGLLTADIKDAETFIDANVKGRECFLMAKNGEIVYESGNINQVFKGYSMTKTIGFILVLMAASQGELDIDADITAKYDIPSPKTYGVTLRMMMSMVLGGGTGPGELWRYDELGDMWMGLIPKVLQQATGKSATQWFQQLHQDMQLSPSFTWPTVETQWGFGASGTCEDWGRFAQLLLNNGYWGNTSIITPSLMQQAQQPVKYDPYNFYSNPCYGLGWWLNPDKEQYNGCCWEASRLVPPNCNNETFIQGGTHKLSFTLGLYGQVILAIPERNVTIVSLGHDLRPIEPIRIGVYPGVCKMLGLPCNTPPKVPEPKCGETLECLGMSAQCFSGYGKWSHEEPKPGGAQCIECFMQRVRDQTSSSQQIESRKMIKDNCPYKNPHALSNYLSCFCYDGDNVFGPWPTTTTTTPAPKPMPPVPHPYTTPAPKPRPPCDVPPTCWESLNKIGHDGGKCVDKGPYNCGKCLFENWGPGKALAKHQCPGTNVKLGFHPYDNWAFTTLGLCLCGPLHPENCPAKVAGVCNGYHLPVTLSNPKVPKDKRTHAYSCTAAAGGKCQVGSDGQDGGEQITRCGEKGQSVDFCVNKKLPTIVSDDKQVDFQFWLNLSFPAINGIDTNRNYTNFGHTCGYHEQWSIVVDANAKVSFYPSENGLSCPSGLFRNSSTQLQYV